MRVALAGPCWCLYGNLWLPRTKLSVEHIVPRSVLKRYDLPLWDAQNLALTQLSLNQARSNYRFVLNWKKNDEGFSVDHRTRTCYPGRAAEGVVAWSLLAMLDRYPELQEESEFLIDPDALEKWM